MTFPDRMLAAPPNGQGGGHRGGGGGDDDDSSGTLEVLRYRIKNQEQRHAEFAKETREERRELETKIDKLAVEIKEAREWIIRFVAGALAIGGFLNLLALAYGFIRGKP